jgi:hypothetical protein
VYVYEILEKTVDALPMQIFSKFGDAHEINLACVWIATNSWLATENLVKLVYGMHWQQKLHHTLAMHLDRVQFVDMHAYQQCAMDRIISRECNAIQCNVESHCMHSYS